MWLLGLHGNGDSYNVCPPQVKDLSTFSPIGGWASKGDMQPLRMTENGRAECEKTGHIRIPMMRHIVGWTLGHLMTTADTSSSLQDKSRGDTVGLKTAVNLSIKVIKMGRLTRRVTQMRHMNAMHLHKHTTSNLFRAITQSPPSKLEHSIVGWQIKCTPACKTRQSCRAIEMRIWVEAWLDWLCVYLGVCEFN